MSFLGKRIQLKGITQKGKNRIRENSDRWIVLAETDKVLFNPQPGEWLFIAPVGKDQFDKASRWVKATGDKDFLVTVEEI